MNNTFPTEGNLSGLSRKDFQKDINDKKTDLFILKNTKGMEVAVTNYGCAILSIMDTAVLGIPTEKYGFNNDVRGVMGPPSYDKCSFTFSGDTILVIHLK